MGNICMRFGALILITAFVLGCGGSSSAETVRILVPKGLLKETTGLLSRHPGLELVEYPNRQAMADRIGHCQAVITWNITAEALRRAPQLRWIHSLTGGVDGFLRFPKLRDNPDIVLTSMKIQKGPEMADHAMALLLALTRNLPQFIRNMDTAKWKNNSTLPIIELRGKTMLIIGMGGCGTQVAERAHASGMRVIGTDPKDIPFMGAVEYVGKPDELHDLLPKADVIVSCAPSTSQTKGLLDEKAFGRMKNEVYIVNVSRGSLIVTDALVDSLRSGKVRAAGLDVVAPEPLPENHPLWAMPNVVITPHFAGLSDGRRERQRELALENIDRFLRGLPLKNVINKKLGY